MFDVQFITHFTASISYSDSARIALEGGCRWVQLRMKDASSEELKATARLHRLRSFPLHNYQTKVITHSGAGRLSFHPDANARRRNNNSCRCHRWNHT